MNEYEIGGFTMPSKYTEKLLIKMQDWGLDMIEQIDDDIFKLEENGKAIVEYLNNIHFSMPLGMALRIHIAEKYKQSFDEATKTYTFALGNGIYVKTKDYNADNYDYLSDDLSEYTDVIISLIKTYNTESANKIMEELNRQEIRRLLKAETCKRSKMFLLGFALHMNDKEIYKFLTDILAEQTYNYRNPKEIIALFCQSHEEHNTYAEYMRLTEAYNKLEEIPSEEKEYFTNYAKNMVEDDIQTEEELMLFLSENKANFNGYSRTSYNEFKRLYYEAMSMATYTTEKYEIKHVKNSEQLAKAILEFIPRANWKKTQIVKQTKEKKKVVVNDFIPVYNGENGQNSKKVITTNLSKDITKNLLIADRLEDLIKQEKTVKRKDLVFMKYYVFSLYLQKKEEYLMNDCFAFMDECNDILIRCGMSKLYVGNRFENLIMLSLAASKPYEMFGNIIESTFFNEPSESE